MDQEPCVFEILRSPGGPLVTAKLIRSIFSRYLQITGQVKMAANYQMSKWFV